MKRNIIDITITSTIPVKYRVELFNALADRTTAQNMELDAINTAAGFISTSTPANTLEGQIKIPAQGNGNGCISWLAAFGLTSLIHLSNNGLQSCLVSTNSDVWTYRQMIELLKTEKIKIGVVKIISADTLQIKNPWTVINKYPDKTESREEIVLSTMILPTQVRADILEFNFNRVIDKYTSIEMDINPLNIGTKITMEFEII